MKTMKACLSYQILSALALGLVRAPAPARAAKHSAFVTNAHDLRDAVHDGVQHIVVKDHCDFTSLDMGGWWHHLKPAATMETIQGDCGAPAPRVPGPSTPLRPLKPRQCVVAHDANLLGFISLSPTHHWLSNLYFRIVSSDRALQPVSLTLHDAAWVFLDDITWQSDGMGGAALAMSVSAKEQVYLQRCLFADLQCPGCPAVADIAGLVEFKDCEFDALDTRSTDAADEPAAAVVLHAYGAHETHEAGAPPPVLRMEANVFADVQPFAVLTEEPLHPEDPVPTVYTDSTAQGVITPNSTVEGLAQASGLFLEGQHEWYEDEKREAEAVRNGNGAGAGAGLQPQMETPNQTKPKLSARVIGLAAALAAVVAVFAAGLLWWNCCRGGAPAAKLAEAEDGGKDTRHHKQVSAAGREPSQELGTYLPVPPPPSLSLYTGHSQMSHTSYVSHASHVSQGSYGSQTRSPQHAAPAYHAQR